MRNKLRQVSYVQILRRLHEPSEISRCEMACAVGFRLRGMDDMRDPPIGKGLVKQGNVTAAGHRMKGRPDAGLPVAEGPDRDTAASQS
ncbi:MAG: hypothetical protein H5U16_10885 [Roseovarius sp.]|nr:hypothetical protein [Roseovarius sp.]